MKKAFFVFIIFAILPTYLFQTINGTENENPEIKEENENEEHSHLYTMDQPEFWIYAAISTCINK